MSHSEKKACRKHNNPDKETETLTHAVVIMGHHLRGIKGICILLKVSCHDTILKNNLSVLLLLPLFCILDITQQGQGIYIYLTAYCVLIIHHLTCIVWRSSLQLHRRSELNAPVAGGRHRPRSSERASRLMMHSRAQCMRELL